MPTEPGHPSGHPSHGAIRRNSRVVGIALAVVGVVVLVSGIFVFAQAFRGDYDPFEEDGIPKPLWGMGLFLLGGILLTAARALLAAGYGGAVLKYAAGEAAPALRDLGVAGADGAFCSRCGVRNRASARFCDACGTRVAQPS